jgi:hypothetical protein
MRILIRTSKWAVWGRRFGALALPLAAIPVLLHRAHIIGSDDFVLIEAVAMALAALAVLAALVAFVRLWFTGDQGWWRASVALVFGALCLVPGAYFASQTLARPSFADVTTDFGQPPALVSFVPARFIGPEERARIEALYPNARSRNYPIEAPQMFEVVEALFDAEGWDLRARRAPLSALDGGQLNAVVTTLLGFQQEVAIRVSGAADGSTVAMRSVSLTGHPDFGENGARIERFLLALDNQVTTLLRNAPAASAE